eukprot:6248779-Amphidinium_carterae.1
MPVDAFAAMLKAWGLKRICASYPHNSTSDAVCAAQRPASDVSHRPFRGFWAMSNVAWLMKLVTNPHEHGCSSQECTTIRQSNRL